MFFERNPEQPRRLGRFCGGTRETARRLAAVCTAHANAIESAKHGAERETAPECARLRRQLERDQEMRPSLITLPVASEPDHPARTFLWADSRLDVTQLVLLPPRLLESSAGKLRGVSLASGADRH